MNRPAVVFDLDGTLADTPSLIARLIGTVLREFGRVPDQAEVLATVGRPLEASFAKLLRVEPDAPETAAAAARYRAAFADALAQRGADLLFPGVLDGLAELRAAGTPLGVATSKISASANALLNTTGIAGFFGVVVGHDQVARGKPHPDMGLAALAALDAPVEGSWYVGDTGTDMAMAGAAGMRALGAGYGVDTASILLAAGAERVVDSFPEVTAALLTGPRYAATAPF